MPNVTPMKTVWINEYQNSHYKQAVFPMWADQRFESQLQQGASIKWSYDGDMGVGRMGSDGGYSLENRTITDETLTVDQRPYAGFNIPTTENIQDHRPTQEKWAKKSMNAIYQDIDGVMLGSLKSAAASSLSAGDFGGAVGDPITSSPSNASSIFAAARRQLRNQNVIYDMNKKFTNVISKDKGEKMPIATIPAELEEHLLLQIGFKNTELGDQTLKQGYLGLIFGFNTVVSTSLPFSFRLVATLTPTDGATLTVGGVVVATWETGAIDAAGKVKAQTSAAVSVAALVAYLNAPYTTSATAQAQVRSSLTIAQRRIFDNISAVDNLDGSCVITVNGQGALSVSETDANITLDRQAVHALFGTSQSIAMIMQKTPTLDISAGSLVTTGELTGYAAKHFLTWTLYGKQVFTSQSKQIVNVPIACSLFSTPNSVVN